MSDDQLLQWVIYDHPSDYPEHFLVRTWIVDASGLRPGTIAWPCETLSLARRAIALAAPGSVCLTRSPEDDPVIVETWL